MADDALLASVDLLARGGVCLLLLLVAALLVRDHGRVAAARLGAVFALGAAAYAICSGAGFHARMSWWAIPILALATGNNVVFWLFARALFDDGFRPRWWHGGLWGLIVAIGLADGFLLKGSAPAAPVGGALALAALGFAALAVVQTVASWRADLIERRRQLRLFIVGASSVYIVLTALANLLGMQRAAPLAVSLTEACGLAAIAIAVAWSLLRVAAGGSLFPPPEEAAGFAATTAGPAPAGPPRLDPVEERLVAALEHAMRVERAYRQEGLTIGRLAIMQGLPEYRLQRLINQGLGYRNFNSFLNRYRIADAKAALADPAQAAVPILTIALDAGFNSLGPFNRAFKAETGMTPTDYRRSRGAGPGRAPVDFGIGEPASATAGRNSNPA